MEKECCCRARRKALLAPVQRYRRGWVQLRTDSAYRVLKWVPRDMVPGTTIGAGQLEGFLEEPDEIDASTDDEEEEGEGEGEEGEERSGEDSEAVGSGRGRSTGETHEDLHDSSATRCHTKGLKMERKTSKAVEDTERVGGQLAGLETGQIAEQVIEDDDEEEDEPARHTVADPERERDQTLPAPMDEDGDGQQPEILAAYPPPQPEPSPSTLLPQGLEPSSNLLPSAHDELAADLSHPSYAVATPTDREPTMGAPPTIYPTQAPELPLGPDQGLPTAPPLSNTLDARCDLQLPDEQASDDHVHPQQS